jgi:hypothetical protein
VIQHAVGGEAAHGHGDLDHRPAPPWAWASLIGSGLIFGLLSYRQTIERARTEPQSRAQAPRLVLLIPALALWGAAFPGFQGNLFRPLPALAWLAGLVLVYLAFALPRGSLSSSTTRMYWRPNARATSLPAGPRASGSSATTST